MQEVRARLDETIRVENDTAIEPARIGCCAGHNEYMADVMRVNAFRLVVPPLHALEMPGSFELCDFRVGA